MTRDLASTITLLFVDINLSSAPNGYEKKGDGYYYKYCWDKKKWRDAQDVWAKEGGNLAIIWNGTRDY